MNPLHALLVRRYGRETTFRYAFYPRRLPTLTDLGWVAGLVTLLVIGREPA